MNVEIYVQNQNATYILCFMLDEGHKQLKISVEKKL